MMVITDSSESFRERMWRFLPRLAFWPTFIRFLGLLGIRRFLKRSYCKWFGPNGGQVSLQVAGITAQFYVHSQQMADSLRRLQGEGQMLEAMIGTLQAGDCVFDVGAEQGLFALFLARKIGEEGSVVAFEPYAEARERLMDNIKLNGLKNIRVFHDALSDRTGEAMLLSGLPGFAPTLKDTFGGSERFSVADRVRVTEGDTLIRVEGLPIPNAVKIDAEGAEDAVVRGLVQTLSNPICSLLCCEIHPHMLPTGVSPEMVLSRINSLGFNSIDVKPRGETLHAVCRKSRS